MTPYPLQAGKQATITTNVINTSSETQTIRILFGVANFGFDIPFTNANIVPTVTVPTLGPGVTRTVSAVWTPANGRHWCVQVILSSANPSAQYPQQLSQRNVDIERGQFKPCQPFTKDFILQSAASLTITVSIETNVFNLPAG